MIKGALFTIGLLATLGCGAMAVLTVMADSMSDAPVNDNASVIGWGVGALVGIGMIVGACFMRG